MLCHDHTDTCKDVRSDLIHVLGAAFPLLVAVALITQPDPRPDPSSPTVASLIADDDKWSEALRARLDLGARRYGSPLRVDPGGRIPWIDRLQEMMDTDCYAYQLIGASYFPHTVVASAWAARPDLARLLRSPVIAMQLLQDAGIPTCDEDMGHVRFLLSLHLFADPISDECDDIALGAA